MENTRDIGKKLEEFVCQRLREALKDPGIRPTKNSGASTELEDIRCKEFIIECKHRNTKSITLNSDVWNHLTNQIPVGSIRKPVYILRNQEGKIWVCMDFENWLTLIEKEE